MVSLPMLKRFVEGRGKALLAPMLCFFLVLIAGCKEVKDIYSPKEWRDLFKDAGGWTPLPFPDSKYKPGSIIKVGDDGVRWIDHLDACRYPTEVLEMESYVPSITFTKKWEFGASAIINFKGITVGPDFKRISKIRMEVIDQGADAFRILKLKVWMEIPANREKVSQICTDELSKPDRYLVTEAFRVSKGRYVLYDKNGVAIKIETPILRDLLQFQPDVKYEVMSDGSLVIEQTAYLAIRKAVQVGEDFEVLGSYEGEPKTADTKIEKLFFKSVGK